MNADDPLDLVKGLFSEFRSLGEGLKSVEVSSDVANTMSSEFDAIKDELRKDYPTYNALLEVAAMHVMQRDFVQKKIEEVMNTMLSEASALMLSDISSKFEICSDSDKDLQARLMGAEIVKIVKRMVSDDLEDLSARNLNKVKGEIRVDGSINGAEGADILHSKPGGSREKRHKIRAIWATGKYESRDVCAEQECAALGMSFSTARKALRNTPDHS